MTWQVIHSDCVTAMREMPEASVDAVVTDPPAGIAFMNRAWDGNRGGRDRWIEWLTEVMAECLRLLKPGGHALVWALPRTSHWTGMALEDAGFEVRDVVTHHFGSGFPKSLDVSKAIDRQRNDRPDILRVTLFLADAAEQAGITRARVDEHMGTSDMGDWWLSRLPHRCACPTWDQWLQLKALICCGDEMDAEVWRLNGRKGTPGGAWGQREVVGQHNLPAFKTTSHGWRAPGEIANPTSLEAQRWSGWGTALKPSTEFWFLARRPFVGSVAANVLQHGTGALNIDSARVGTSDDLNGGAYTDGRRPRAMAPGGAPRSAQLGEYEQPAGRFPPNLALVHSAGCLRVGTRRVKGSGFDRNRPDRTNGLVYNPSRGKTDFTGYASPDGTEEVEAWRCEPNCPIRLLDEQSGSVRSSGHYEKTPADMGYGRGGHGAAAATYADSGSASRFFPQFSWEHERAEAGFLYQAKASRRERNAGLDGFVERASKKLDGGVWRANVDYAPEGTSTTEDRRARNIHSTVKPLSLMRWLVRLVGGQAGSLVLDPFCGSGTTGAACVLEGFRFIGIEQSNAPDEPYVDIARARIAYWADPGAHAARLAEARRLARVEDDAEPTVEAQLGLFETPPAPSVDRTNREGEASAGRRYTERGSSNFAMKPGRRRGA